MEETAIILGEGLKITYIPKIINCLLRPSSKNLLKRIVKYYNIINISFVDNIVLFRRD